MTSQDPKIKFLIFQGILHSDISQRNQGEKVAISMKGV